MRRREVITRNALFEARKEKPLRPGNEIVSETLDSVDKNRATEIGNYFNQCNQREHTSGENHVTNTATQIPGIVGVSYAVMFILKPYTQVTHKYSNENDDNFETK